MPYVYAAMWFIVGLILVFRMSRENRVFYIMGAFFILLGGWWLANAALGANLFTGVWGWVLRAITAAVLILACVVYYKESKKSSQDSKSENHSGDDEK